ncbi:MAG: flagellar export protein FliJ [Mycobacterium sp.]
MAFRFALASLLRLRQGVERQRALALQQACLQVTRARDALGRLDNILAESWRTDAHSLAVGCVAAELHFAGQVREQLKRLRTQLLEEIRRLEDAQQQAAARYQQAKREREVMEAVRDQQSRVYELEQLRREQRSLDAAFLLRGWPKKSG